MRRAVFCGMAALGLLGGVIVSMPSSAAAAPTPAYVSLLLGRSMFAQSDGCRATGPNLFQLASRLAALGVRATGVVVPGRTSEAGVRCLDGNLYPSWTDLARLRNEFGWSFVSNGQKRVNIIDLSPAARIAESCGSLKAFEAHGHTRAWGMYGPGSNYITDAIARSPVGTCFGFTRLYSGSNVNLRSTASVAPWYARTNDTNGGVCNLAPCSGNAGLGKRYMLPSSMKASLAQAQPDRWIVLSTYKLVEGARTSGERRWDCTASDPRKHWTSEVESYCLKDLLDVLAAIPPTAKVVDPATVAQAWGHAPGHATSTSGAASSPATKVSSATILPATEADRWSYWGYLWSDGTRQANGAYFFSQGAYRDARSYARFARGAAANGVVVAKNSNGNYYSVTPRPHPPLPVMTGRSPGQIRAFLAAVIEDEGSCLGLLDDGPVRADVAYLQTLFDAVRIPTVLRQVNAKFFELRIATSDQHLLGELPFATNFRTPGSSDCTVPNPTP